MAESTLEALRRLLGTEGVREGPRPTALPLDAAQASALMKLAVERKWWVMPIGAGTWLGHLRADVLVSTERMSQLHAYEPSDPTASVGAGLSLLTLAEQTAKHGQWLPLDPPGDARSTVGAALALGAAGPLRWGYGTAREHVLGLELVTGDGRVLSLGGKVLKNVAGYDLTRLVVGSRGALGLITRVHLKLRPKPEADDTVCFVSEELEVALAAARKALSRPEAVAVELLSPSLSQNLLGAPRWTVLARLQGETEAVAAARKAFDFATAQPDLWRRLSAEEQAGLSVRLSDRATALAGTLRLAATLGRAHVAAHAGDGIVRVFQPELNAGRLAAARTELETAGGALLALPPPKDFPAFGGPGNAGATMRGLKKAFDPHAILSDGGFGFLTG